MAVYTALNKQDIQGILKEYQIGELVKYLPISSGIENTNYFVWTSDEHASLTGSSEWVLTVFENLPEADIPFFNHLTSYLQGRGFYVPAPVVNRHGKDIFYIQYGELLKYGVIVPRFKGRAITEPDMLDCKSIAEYIAKMHLALEKSSLEKKIEHSIEWCHGLIRELRPKVSQEDSQLLELAINRYEDYCPLICQCPQGVVHGDLFRDNVLFDHKAISGVIDFYHAGTTAYLFDLAVIANDWAVNFDNLPALFDENHLNIPGSSQKCFIYNEKKLLALINAYESVRALNIIEVKAWPRLLELAAFRFWLSRLKTKLLEGYQQDAKAGEVIKSPEAMKLVLLAAMERV